MPWFEKPPSGAGWLFYKHALTRSDLGNIEGKYIQCKRAHDASNRSLFSSGISTSAAKKFLVSSAPVLLISVRWIFIYGAA
jgi:hypothetical protein